MLTPRHLALLAAVIAAAACDPEPTEDEEYVEDPWMYRLPSDPGAEPRPALRWEVGEAPAHVLVRDDDAVLVYKDHRFERRSSDTGEVLSKGRLPVDFAPPEPYGLARPATGLQNGDRRFLRHGDHLVLAYGTRVTAISLADGSVLWDRDLSETKPFTRREEQGPKTSPPVEVRLTSVNDDVAVSLSHYSTTASCAVLLVDPGGATRWSMERDGLCGVLGTVGEEFVLFDTFGAADHGVAVARHAPDGTQSSDRLVVERDELEIAGDKLIATGGPGFEVYELTTGKVLSEQDGKLVGIADDRHVLVDVYSEDSYELREAATGKVVRRWPWRSFDLVVADGSQLYMRTIGHHDVLVALDRTTDGAQVLDLEFPDRGQGTARHWFAGMRMLDLTGRDAPRRQTVPLADDIRRWIAKSDFHSDKRLELLTPEQREPVVDEIVAGSRLEDVAKIAEHASRDAVHRRLERALSSNTISPDDVLEIARTLRDDETVGAGRVIQLALESTFDKPSNAPWNDARLGLLGARFPSSKYIPRRHPDDFLRQLVARTAEWVAQTPAEELASTRLGRLAPAVAVHANLSSDTPGIATPLLGAIRNRGAQPLCFMPDAKDEGTCRDGAVPGRAVVLDGVAVFQAENWSLRGALLVMRRENEIWAGPYFTGLRSYTEQFRQERKWTDDLVVLPTEDGLTVTFRPTFDPNFDPLPELRTETFTWAQLTADRDGDGWTDRFERTFGTDPERADTDGDGRPDAIDAAPTCSEPATKPDEVLTRDTLLTFVRQPGMFRVDDFCVDVPSLDARFVPADSAVALSLALGEEVEPPHQTWEDRLRRWWAGVPLRIHGPSHHEEWRAAPLREGRLHFGNEGSISVAARRVQGQWRVFTTD